MANNLFNRTKENESILVEKCFEWNISELKHIYGRSHTWAQSLELAERKENSFEVTNKIRLHAICIYQEYCCVRYVTFKIKFWFDEQEEEKNARVVVKVKTSMGLELEQDYTALKYLSEYVELRTSDGRTRTAVKSGVVYDLFQITVLIKDFDSIQESETCWSSVKSNDKFGISSDLNVLLTNKKFADFTFKVQGKEFQVHKAVLAARSSVMMTMFSGEFKEKIAGEISLSHVTSKAFEDFLSYVYTDSVKNLNDRVIELLQMAHLYEVKGLKVICEDHLLRGLNEENSSDVFQYAHLYECSQTLKAKSFSYIKRLFARNNYEIPESFVDLPLEVQKLIEARKTMDRILIKGPAKG